MSIRGIVYVECMFPGDGIQIVIQAVVNQRDWVSLRLVNNA